MDAYFTKGTDQIVFFHLEANTIKITHGYIDIAGVNPPPGWMEWNTFGEKPKTINSRTIDYSRT